MDLHVSGHLAQSESAKPDNFRELDAENRIPLAGEDLRYLRTFVAAV